MFCPLIHQQNEKATQTVTTPLGGEQDISNQQISSGKCEISLLSETERLAQCVQDGKCYRSRSMERPIARGVVQTIPHLKILSLTMWKLIFHMDLKYYLVHWEYHTMGPMGNVYLTSHDVQPLGYPEYSGNPMKAPLPIGEVEEGTMNTKKVAHLDIFIVAS